MRRISLDQTTRFPSLTAFLAKEPPGVTPSARPITTPGGPHRYAYGYQNGTNYGGNSWLNLWNPTGDFTLSQQWYVNGSGSGTQTAEGGWVNYPGKFGNQSVLFIFFTPNDYASGCYNLECSGFVQTNSSIALGTTWSAYSSYGGDQYGFSLQYEYSGGNWWLFVQGTALGYYPGSVYNGGPMASNASLSEFGGETYTDGSNWQQLAADGQWPVLRRGLAAGRVPERHLLPLRHLRRRRLLLAEPGRDQSGLLHDQLHSGLQRWKLGNLLLLRRTGRQLLTDPWCPFVLPDEWTPRIRRGQVCG